MNHSEATAFAKSFHPDAVAEAQDGYWSVVIPTMIEYATELGPEFEGTPVWKYRNSVDNLRSDSQLSYSRPVEQHADNYNLDEVFREFTSAATARNRRAAGKRSHDEIYSDVARLSDEGGPELVHATLPQEEIQDWLHGRTSLMREDLDHLDSLQRAYDDKWHPIDRDRDEW